MAEDLIRYDILTQEALRGVVRKVLSEVARTGLPGSHHFFIAFATRAPGVRLSERLLEKYEKEMTIVLQNQFRDLKVSETGFEVGLSFDGQPETLFVPFTAMKGFFDPSVQFGMEFHSDRLAEPLPAEASLAKPPAKASPAKSAPTPPPTVPEQTSGEKVISLDAFRKKP